MSTTFRLLLKSVRFELGAVLIGTLLLSGAALFVTVRLDAIGIPRDCLYELSGPPPVEPTAAQATHEDACQPKREAFYDMVNSDADRVLAIMAGFPLIAGLLVGVPLVGREIEWGTAPLVWTLARSRRRWLLARALPLGIVLGLVLAAPAIAGQILEGASHPAVAPNASLQDFGLRGAPIVARGLLAFGVAVLAGAVLGRQLPALIVAGSIGIALFLVADGVQGTLLKSLPTTVWASSAEPPPGSLFVDVRIRDAAGELHPLDGQSMTIGGGSDDGTQDVLLLASGTEYPFVAAVWSFGLGAIALAFVGVSAEVVERRRAT